MIAKRILCLANSRKLSGRCVAGREAMDAGAGGWIRPVSTRADGAVSEYERCYADGSDPRILDVIEVPLIRAVPVACQSENWLLEPSRYWTKRRRIGWEELLGFVQTPPQLWINGHSTYHGQHDEMPQSAADALPGSLYLIRVDGLDLRVFAPGQAFGETTRRVQCVFLYRGTRYALRVTDPIVEREYLQRADGTYQIGESCLTLSLSEPFAKKPGQSCRYKLVAAIIRRDEGPWP